MVIGKRLHNYGKSPFIIYIYTLFGGLEHEFYGFPYIGNSNPNWLFFRGVAQPPTRW